MGHDMIAELSGFRTELENLERFGHPNKDRATAVKGEIERVASRIRLEAQRLLAQAETHEESGQDVLAAQCRVEAKRLVREGRIDTPEDAAESAPRKKSVPAKGKRGGE